MEKQRNNMRSFEMWSRTFLELQLNFQLRQKIFGNRVETRKELPNNGDWRKFGVSRNF